MNLTKFLRKNSRTLLMVFMSLLLVAFLIPNTIQGLSSRGRSRNLKLGEAYGKTIHTTDIDFMRGELSVLRRLGVPVPLPEGALLECYLLKQEAKRNGIRISNDQVKDWLRQRGVTNDYVQKIQDTTHLPYDRIYSIVGEWMAVLRLADLQTAAIAPSLPRQEIAYRDQNQEADALFSLLSAEAFLDQVPEPTDEELQAFFDQWKSVPPPGRAGGSETELEFGYRLPDRVAVEYLTLDPATVTSEVTVRGTQVRDYFDEHRNEYARVDTEAVPEPGQQAPRIQLTYEEAQDRVREDYREFRAMEMAQSIVNEMYDEAALPWHATGHDDDGFVNLPDQQISFEELRDKYAEKYPVEYARTELAGEVELRRVPIFGRSNLTEGTRRLPAARLALRVKGIINDANDTETRQQGPVLNVLEPAPVVMAPDPMYKRWAYQAVLFRVVEVAPSAPPESLDGIRDEVVSDWKLAQAFELAGQHARQLAESAREVGLEQAVADATELRDILTASEQAATQPAEENAPPPRNPQYLSNLEPFASSGLTRNSTNVKPRVGRTATLAHAVFDLANETGEHHAAAVPIANQARWVVAELREVKPIYEEPFKQQLAQSALQVRRQEIGQFARGWFDPDSISARTGFEMSEELRRSRQPREEAEESAPDEAAS